MGVEAVSQDSTDVRTEITKIKQHNPEAVFLATYSRQMGFILKQAKALNFSTVFIGGEGTKDNTLIEVAGQGAEELIGLVPSVPETGTRSAFLAAFKEKYNDEPGLTADSAYDIPYLLKIAMEECEDIYDVDCLKNELLQINKYEGASGIITFDENGDLAEKTYAVVTVKNGKFEIVNE